MNGSSQLNQQNRINNRNSGLSKTMKNEASKRSAKDSIWFMGQSNNTQTPEPTQGSEKSPRSKTWKKSDNAGQLFSTHNSKIGSPKSRFMTNREGRLRAAVEMIHGRDDLQCTYNHVADSLASARSQNSNSLNRKRKSTTPYSVNLRMMDAELRQMMELQPKNSARKSSMSKLRNRSNDGAIMKDRFMSKAQAERIKQVTAAYSDLRLQTNYTKRREQKKNRQLLDQNL